MDISSITPKPEENINIIKALEYLAYKWIPYTGDDEFIVDSKRIDKRVDNYFFTDKKMIEAAAILSNLIRNQKVKINSYFITPMLDDFYHIIKSSMCIKITDNMLYVDPLINYDILKKQEIKNVSIKYIEFKKNTNIPSLLNFTPSSLKRISNGNAYLPVIFINIGDLLLVCADSKECIKFSELKACYEDETIIKKENINKVINDNTYTTPLIQIVNAMIMKYGDEINKNKKETVLAYIEEMLESFGYKKDKDYSANDVKSVFRIIRHPDTKKGGAKPQVIASN